MAEKSASRDAAVAAIAKRQHGVVSIRQLRSVGLSDDAVWGRVRAGRLHRVHRGVYAVGHAGLSAKGRWMAAVLACGGGTARAAIDTAAFGQGSQAATDGSVEGTALGWWGAALSYRSAAGLWGLLPVTAGSVDVSVAGQGGRRRRAGIRLHRCASLSPAMVTLRDGIPVTTPGRTLLDLRRAAMRSGGVTRSELRRAMRQADMLGFAIEVEANPERTRSDLERDFLRLCRRHGLPQPEVNVRIGRYVVDFLWRDPGLVVETDGYRYHRGPTAFVDDRRRDLALTRMGYEVLRLSGQQVSSEPRSVAEAMQIVISARTGS